METLLLILVVAAALVGLGAALVALFAGRGRILSLLRREAIREFCTPRAWLLLGLFLAVSGLAFYNSILPRSLGGREHPASATMAAAFDYLFIVLPFLVPLLTMRLFAEEARAGTIETLLTSPVTDLEIVAAKFLGALLLYALMLAMTSWHVFVLYAFGSPGPDPGSVLTSYLGFLLLGAMLISLGCLASSLTQSQAAAAMMSFFPALALTLLRQFRGAVSDWPLAAGLVDYASLHTRMTGFLEGALQLNDVVYFVSLTAFFLFLTVRSVESRRWR